MILTIDVCVSGVSVINKLRRAVRRCSSIRRDGNLVSKGLRRDENISDNDSFPTRNRKLRAIALAYQSGSKAGSNDKWLTAVRKNYEDLDLLDATVMPHIVGGPALHVNELLHFCINYDAAIPVLTQELGKADNPAVASLVVHLLTERMSFMSDRVLKDASEAILGVIERFASEDDWLMHSENFAEWFDKALPNKGVQYIVPHLQSAALSNDVRVRFAKRLAKKAMYRDIVRNEVPALFKRAEGDEKCLAQIIALSKKVDCIESINAIELAAKNYKL